MSSIQEPELSSIELRSKLFHTFKAKGILQSVKTHLRNRLVSELQQTNANKDWQQRIQKEESLLLCAANSLVAAHLSRCSYDYTLSVFASESLTNPDKLYSVSDILHLLHIHPQSKLYQKLITIKEDETNIKGFLWSFMSHLAAWHGSPLHDSHTQTEGSTYTADYTSLDEKLLFVEREELKKFHEKNNDDAESLQAKFVTFQKKYEAQKKAELSVEIERFKNSELVNMRLEERTRYQSEVALIRSEYDQLIKKKFKELEEQEARVFENSTRQKKILETEAYEQRQKLLSDFQVLKERELHLQQANELALKSIEIREEGLRSKEEHVKCKEESLKNIEEKYENKLQSEIIKLKLELQQEEKLSADSFQARLQQLKEEKISFESQKHVYLRWKDEAERLREENKILNQTLIGCKENLSMMGHKCETLAQENEKINDYDVLKSDKMALERDVELLKRNIEGIISEKTKREREHQKLVKDLLGKISGVPNPENIQKELEDCKRKENKWRDRFNDLQNKYEIEILKNEEIRKLYDDSLLSQRELLRELDELKTALYMANQEKERLLRSKESREGNTHNLGKTIFQKYTTADRVDKRLWLQNNDLVEDDIVLLTEDKLSENVLTHNHVMEKLEQEALALERSYRDYQERQRAPQSRSPSRVHFSSYIQQQTHSGNRVGDFHLTNPTGVLGLSMLHSNPENTIFSAETTRFSDPFTTTSTNPTVATVGANQQRLSSTQTADGYDAPSFGLSRVQDTNAIPRLTTPGGNREESSSLDAVNVTPALDPNDIALQKLAFRTKPTIGAVTGQIRTSTAGATSDSLTQQVLQEPTIPVNSLTQYPLYESKNTNNFTQYPLVDSNLYTPITAGRNLVTPTTQRLDTLDEQSVSEVGMSDSRISTLVLNAYEDVTENIKVENKNAHQENRDSLERDHQLREASISTFESPLKSSINEVNYTSDQRGLMIKCEVSTSLVASSQSHATQDLSPVNSNSIKKSSSLSKMDLNDLIQSPTSLSLSEGEIKMDKITSIEQKHNKNDDLHSSASNTESIKEATFNTGKADLNEENSSDVMAKYMKMVLEKREKEFHIKDEEAAANQSSVVDDIAASEVENISEKSSVSEFEW